MNYNKLYAKFKTEIATKWDIFSGTIDNYIFITILSNVQASTKITNTQSKDFYIPVFLS